MQQRILQMRGLFLMRAHGGWAHALLARARALPAPGMARLGPALDRVLDRMEEYTQRRTEAFDVDHGTETFKRLFVQVTDDGAGGPSWGYAAINQDFFREIMRSIPVDLSPFTFVDIGSGKGAAVFLASEFPFRRLVGVELTEELVALSKRNTDAFNRKTGKGIAPEWVHRDFFKWEIPNEPQLFFFNNPFPEDITLSALQTLERSIVTAPRPSLLVFRKAPKSTGDFLHQSKLWKPLCLAPYWRVYGAHLTG